jgi:hypothetical protein
VHSAFPLLINQRGRESTADPQGRGVPGTGHEGGAGATAGRRGCRQSRYPSLLTADPHGMAIKNAPTTPNTGGYETRTAESKRLADKTAGANASMAANVFETRVAQESGTH